VLLRRNHTSNQFRPNKNRKLGFISFIALFAVIGGIVALYSAKAAPAIVLDTSIPQPQNVKAFGDDRMITVTWDHVDDSRVVGYYLTYRRRGSSDEYKVKQTTWTRTQIQPIVNGVEYEVNVQSAAGTVQVITDNGPLVNAESDGSHYARGNGRVSNKSTVNATPSSARVDAMRSRLTGFFDDFNTSAGPMSELKWNTAATSCVQENTAAAFLNDQFHAHNVVRSGRCDRAGLATRPRATFDTTTGINGGPLSETNPAQIEWDMDGAFNGRDVWYLDLIPLDSRKYNLPLDITSHNDPGDGDNEDPGNLLRLKQGISDTAIAYYNINRNEGMETYDERKLLDIKSTNNDHCGDWNGSRVATFADCDFTQKTPGLSPLPAPTDPIASFQTGPVPNVRNHWVVQLTPTKIKLFVNSTQIGEGTLPADFAVKRKFTLHSTVFSYNTGKQTYGYVVPYIQMFHWDNFGFTGTAPTETIYNYQEGGPDGRTPVFATAGANYEIPEGPRTTIIPIPDQIGNLVGNKARLYITFSNYNGAYSWVQGDHIIINGRRYDFTNPDLDRNNVRANYAYADAISPSSHVIFIDKADLRQGDNTLTMNLLGSGDPAEGLNVHLELPYAANDPAKPSYTTPEQIFGTPYRDITKPPMTNCDQYAYVEQDLDLPYETGKANLVIGPCQLMTSHQTTTPPTGQIPQCPALSRHIICEAEFGQLNGSTTKEQDTSASNNEYIIFH
jgi:hypothetical protein